MADFILIIFGFIICLIMDYSRKKEIKENLDPGCNPGLHLIYEIDEFYKLRLQFDEIIEPVWQKYRTDEITRDEYKVASDAAVVQIIGEENANGEFNSLLRFGAKNAAYRIAREGYNPGSTPFRRTTRELRYWKPRCWEGDPDCDSRPWRLKKVYFRSFLDMYPSAHAIGEIYDVGTYDRSTGTWTNKCKERGYGYNTYGFYGKENVEKTLQLLNERGYDGKTYLNMPKRDFGDLTKEEIKKKYEFIDTLWRDY